ncbi:MAG: sugar transferase [Deltaproteobacteria bacterium RIFCSPLOWO2_12_FULL_40_28]|nr:MAG: sugar transferase [Deltaproteobacteria bacterium RIFCSPHIGHO2_02_FULL_40_28]OGQ19629.1 MAG: sugar transferase [Deltaproteobacteria bacterium RIFCSPHIGHO2_12_FULL_40_32]OGQ40906.1 MAG: sugar transferase [Deltaproteobacteria bacterium RIFCSPLOWO2_02_FULL_40_36]OGQ54021.1 MAG: sugar transferase [Deltaproteobacteria bacterium RIFCSPLOWO2_12_FULL_40_28]
MVKRIMDIILSLVGLMLFLPLLIPVIILVWLQDFHSPFYVGQRVGQNYKMFGMVKLRSMVLNAEKTGVQSTSIDDKRITSVGRFIRAYKLDEVMQLWNVFKGDMSLVGPRPNVEKDVALYTVEEKKLLSVKPGVTDLSSIVFSDEGEILKGSQNPDLSYNQIIRPWKSRLGLFYIVHRSCIVDFKLLIITIIAIFSKQTALGFIKNMLDSFKADAELIKVCERKNSLYPFPPPGSLNIVYDL